MHKKTNKPARKARAAMTTKELTQVKGGLGASTYPRWQRALTTWVWE